MLKGDVKPDNQIELSTMLEAESETALTRFKRRPLKVSVPSEMVEIPKPG